MIKHHNFNYAAGPTFPDAIGDRYYAQDLARDYWSKIDDAGRKVAGGFEAFPVLIKDSNVTKGTLWTDINIPIARGIVKYKVDVPNSYVALPPTVTQEDVYVRIETTAEVDFDISGTATLDGATPNYIKVTYAETDGATRTRAKKAGSYVYEKAVSYSISVDAAAPTDYELCLGTLIGDGAASLIIESYIRTKNLAAAYDYVVETQEDFNIIMDYTAANQYRIKDNVKSIYVKYLAGGYQMTGATSPLQEGDVYGYIETNDCTRIVFEPGAFIDMAQSPAYLKIDTNDCYLDGVDIRGDKGGASTSVRSFTLSADRVTFLNCQTSTRLVSGPAFRAFEGSGTASHNNTSCFIDCRVYDIDGSGIGVTAFYNCKNINNCIIYDLSADNPSIICDTCENIKGIKIYQMDTTGASSLIIFDTCKNISDFDITDIDSASLIEIFDTCVNINQGIIEDIQSTGGIVYGIYNSNIINNIYIKQLDATANCYAYTTCTQLSNCYAEDIDSAGGNAYGFYTCDNISTSKASGCDNGFDNCFNVSSCDSTGNSNHGYYQIGRIVSSRASTNAVDGFNDCVTVGFCMSTSNTGDGYQDCDHMEHNRALANGGAAYNNCFADLAATRAAAATDAGGENA